MRSLNKHIGIVTLTVLVAFTAPTARAGFWDWLGCAIGAGFGYLSCGATWLGGAIDCTAQNTHVTETPPYVDIDTTGLSNCLDGTAADPGPNGDFGECSQEVQNDFNQCTE